MSTTDVRLTVAAARPAHVRFVERTAIVPLAATLLLAVLTMPIFVLAPMTVPAGVALVAAGVTYLLGAQRLKAGRTGARLMVGLSALGGIGAIALAWLTSWVLAGRYDAHHAVAPCCGLAFAVPLFVYLVAAALVWTRAGRSSLPRR